MRWFSSESTLDEDCVHIINHSNIWGLTVREWVIHRFKKWVSPVKFSQNLALMCRDTKMHSHAGSRILFGHDLHHHLNNCHIHRLELHRKCLWWPRGRLVKFSAEFSERLLLKCRISSFFQTYTWTVLLALICSWWRRSHCCWCWYCENKEQTICYPSADRKYKCGCEGVISVVTFSMLLWCFCSLSRSVGRATLMNLWIGASRRLSVSLLPSSAMCPADCPQPTPRCNLDTAPAQFYLTAPTVTVNTRRVWFYSIHKSNAQTLWHMHVCPHI